MAEPSTFRGALVFLEKIGVYDVVLPFLLVFTIVFAVFERTGILGMETIEGHQYSKKNLNAMVAFVVAMIVVLSSKLVTAINESMGRIVLLLLISICFLLLIGSFYHYEEKVFLEGWWRTFFMFFMFIGVILIFLSAIKTDSGSSWLDAFWTFLSGNWQAGWTAAVILIVIIVIFIAFITWTPSAKKKGEKKEE